MNIYKTRTKEAFDLKGGIEAFLGIHRSRGRDKDVSRHS